MSCVKRLKTLDNAYLSVEAEYIEGNIDEISHLYITKKCSAAWETVNELTRRKKRSPITIKGGSSEKRIENWTTHFKNLLGQALKTSPDKSIPFI